MLFFDKIFSKKLKKLDIASVNQIAERMLLIERAKEELFTAGAAEFAAKGPILSKEAEEEGEKLLFLLAGANCPDDVMLAAKNFCLATSEETKTAFYDVLVRAKLVRYNFLSAKDCVVRPPAVPPEVIRGILRKGCSMLLSGPSKAKKSYTLIDLAVALSSGQSFLTIPTVQTPTLYINLELEDWEYAIRSSNITEARRIGKNDIPCYSVHLKNTNVDTSELEDIVGTFYQSYKIGCVIIDPVYKVSDIFEDENSAAQVGKFLTALSKTVSSINAAIIYSHHFAKGNAASKNIIDRMSGSGVFARDPNAMMFMTPHKDPNMMVLEFSLRNFAPIPPTSIEWNYPMWSISDAPVEYAEAKTSNKK